MEIDVNNLLSIKNNFLKYSNIKSILIHGNYKEQQPTFSIVIPTYKRISTLKETLASALSQDYQDYYDIIVCDNNPERGDETENYMVSITDERVLYYKNSENIGMVGNWNRCAQLCDGKYLIMIHDDDIMYLNYISKVKHVLDKHSQIDILYPTRCIWHKLNNEIKPIQILHNNGHIYKLGVINYLLGNDDPPTGVLFKKDIMINLGGFDEKAYPSSDYYFNVMAVQHANVYRLKQNLSIYRWSNNESIKFETLLNFRIIGKPLFLYLSNMLKLPKFVKIALLKLYDLGYIETIKVLCPNKLSEVSINDFLLPSNRIEKKAFRIIQRIFICCVNVRNFFYQLKQNL